MRKIGRTFSLFSCDTKIKAHRSSLRAYVGVRRYTICSHYFDIAFVMSEMLNTYSAVM